MVLKLKPFHCWFYFEIWHRKRVFPVWSNLTLVLVSDRSAAVLKAGGGAAVKEQSVAGRTEPDMREKGKHCSRSAGFIDRRVIVHRSADRGAVRLCALCLFLCLLCAGFGRCWALCCAPCVSDVKLRLVLQESSRYTAKWLCCCLWWHLIFSRNIHV